MKLCVNCASSKDTPSCARCWPDFVTAFMTDLRNFYLAGPAVTVSWLLWIFQHATLACCIKNNLPRLYRIHRTRGVQSELWTPGSALVPMYSHVLPCEATAGKRKKKKPHTPSKMSGCTVIFLSFPRAEVLQDQQHPKKLPAKRI